MIVICWLGHIRVAQPLAQILDVRLLGVADLQVDRVRQVVAADGGGAGFASGGSIGGCAARAGVGGGGRGAQVVLARYQTCADDQQGRRGLHCVDSSR